MLTQHTVSQFVKPSDAKELRGQLQVDEAGKYSIQGEDQ
jgi:hypothetical protein